MRARRRAREALAFLAAIVVGTISFVFVSQVMRRLVPRFAASDDGRFWANMINFAFWWPAVNKIRRMLDLEDSDRTRENDQ